MSDSLQAHRLQHARLPCPSLSPGVCSNSCPWSHWCHPTISSSVVPFSSCLQSFPAPGSFPMSQLFTSGGQSIGASASASVLPVNIQGWFPLGLIGLISLQSKGLSRVCYFSEPVLLHDGLFHWNHSCLTKHEGSRQSRAVAPSPAQWDSAAYLCGCLIPGERLVVGSLMPGIWAFPGGSDGKEPICNARDPGSIPAWGRSLEKGMATHSSILSWRIHG